jgi:hypothetical protein
MYRKSLVVKGIFRCESTLLFLPAKNEPVIPDEARNPVFKTGIIYKNLSG